MDRTLPAIVLGFLEGRKFKLRNSTLPALPVRIKASKHQSSGKRKEGGLGGEVKKKNLVVLSALLEGRRGYMKNLLAIVWTG